MSIYQSSDNRWICFDGIEKHYFDTESEARQMSREQDYITTVRSHNRAVWDGIYALKALQAEWTALDYTNNLDNGAGENAGITVAQVSSVVNTTTDALITLLGQGHGTNMARLL